MVVIVPPLFHLTVVARGPTGAFGSPWWDTGPVAEGKPRILQGNRDMVWSMVVLMLLCAAFAAASGLLTFSPGGPEDGPIPEFDAEASLRQDARYLPVAIRLPEQPPGWTANSGRVQEIEGQDSSHVGWVTPGRDYVELVQSLAGVEDFRSLQGGPRPDETTREVDGRPWTVFTGDDVRPVWVSDLGDARVAVTGSAPEADLEKMAAAVQVAEPLPKG